MNLTMLTDEELLRHAYTLDPLVQSELERELMTRMTAMLDHAPIIQAYEDSCIEEEDFPAVIEALGAIDTASALEAVIAKAAKYDEIAELVAEQ